MSLSCVSLSIFPLQHRLPPCRCRLTPKEGGEKAERDIFVPVPLMLLLMLLLLLLLLLLALVALLLPLVPLALAPLCAAPCRCVRSY
jgi:hypothetical protein